VPSREAEERPKDLTHETAYLRVPGML